MFPQITCPVLALEDETSENRIYTDLEKASSWMNQGSYALIKEAGHLLPMERPEKMTPIIMKFFGEVCC